MKKLIVISIVCTSFFACKDKKKDDPAPAVNQISVKINGTQFNCESCGNTYASGGLGGINFFEGGSNRLIFNYSGILSPGNYTLVPYGNPSFSYEKDGRYYRGRGTISLSATDTSSNGAIKKFIGTFQCVTDTFNSTFYNFTEGKLNINFN